MALSVVKSTFSPFCSSWTPKSSTKAPRVPEPSSRETTLILPDADEEADEEPPFDLLQAVSHTRAVKPAKVSTENNLHFFMMFSFKIFTMTIIESKHQIYYHTFVKFL